MDLSSNCVWLEKLLEYGDRKLADCFDRILGPCLQSENLHSSQVLLKPNLITARISPLACTDGRFIIAAARWFLEHGAQVSIGDSPAFGTTASVLHKLGVVDELRNLPIEIVNFDMVRQVTLSSGIKAGLSTHALDCDLLVNMPRVKAHAQLRVSLGVKNLFGCLVGMRKPLWHMTYGGCGGGFADHLVELLSVLPSGVTIADGITAMHRTGPINGQSFPLGVVACSTNPVAVDRALLKILGVRPERSPLMNSCFRNGLVGSDLDILDFPFFYPEDLAVDTFVVPEKLYPIRFNPFRFIWGNMKRIGHKLRLPS